MRKKVKPVRNLGELRYKLAEKMAEFESGELSVSEGKVYIGFAATLLNTFKVEQFNNVASGVNKAIDLVIQAPSDSTGSPLLDEFIKPQQIKAGRFAS
jgi:hypothetical protein